MFKVLLFSLMFVVVSCGSDNIDDSIPDDSIISELLLSTGIYDVELTFVKDEWGGIADGYVVNNNWTIDVGLLNSYTLVVEGGDGTVFDGEEQEDLVVFYFFVDTSDDLCFITNEIEIILEPGGDTATFVGDAFQEINFCSTAYNTEMTLIGTLTE